MVVGAAWLHTTLDDHPVLAELVSIDAAVFALPALLDDAPEEAVAVSAKGGLEVGGLVKVVLELALESVIVGA